MGFSTRSGIRGRVKSPAVGLWAIHSREHKLLGCSKRRDITDDRKGAETREQKNKNELEASAGGSQRMISEGSHARQLQGNGMEWNDEMEKGLAILDRLRFYGHR